MVINRSGNDMLAEGDLSTGILTMDFEQMNNISRRVDSAMAFADNKKYGLDDYPRKMQVRKDTHSINGIEDFMVIHEDNTERVATRLSHNMLMERILEELYDKKKNGIM